MIDIYAWIFVINTSQGKFISNGGHVYAPDNVSVRYFVLNLSDQNVGPFTVQGSIFQNGKKTDVFTTQKITLAAQQLWKPTANGAPEYKFSAANQGILISHFKAVIVADVGNVVTEAKETNNYDEKDFIVFGPPH